MLTGRYPSHRLVRMHAALLPSKNSGNGVVDFLGSGVKNLTVMSKLFQQNGWRTGHFGKWHLGFEGKRPDHPLYGIDEIQTYAASFNQADYGLHQYPTASKKHPRAFDNFDIEFPARSSQVIVDRTIEFIRDRVDRDEKFLVNVWLQNAHAPLNLYLDASEAEAQATENGYASPNNPFPGKGRDTSDLRLKEYLPDQIYRILFREQDRAVKRLVDFIDQSGIGSKTLIIYTSDNGPETEGVYFVGRGSATPYRGKKRSLYEGEHQLYSIFVVVRCNSTSLKRRDSSSWYRSVEGPYQTGICYVGTGYDYGVSAHGFRRLYDNFNLCRLQLVSDAGLPRKTE